MKQIGLIDLIIEFKKKKDFRKAMESFSKFLLDQTWNQMDVDTHFFGSAQCRSSMIKSTHFPKTVHHMELRDSVRKLFW